jgi:hypothetical protein
MVHFHQFHLNSQSNGDKCHHHIRFSDTQFHSTHGHSSNASNLVHILNGQSQGLVEW